MSNYEISSFDLEIICCCYAPVPLWNYANGTHSHWLFYWNRTEGAEIEFNGNSKCLNSRHIALIPPYTTFSTRSSKTFQHFYIHFTAGDPFDRVKREILYLPSNVIVKMFPRLYCSSETEKALVFRILLYEYLLMIPQSAFLPAGESVMDRRIRRAAEIMTSDLSRHHGNAEISRQIGMSLNNFYGLFLKEIGSTPKQYMLSQRMEAARRMLANTKNSIDEIASMTGYADRYHFSKAFKTFYGLPPAAYRNAFEKKD